jgi:hypothetical protein
LIDQAGNTKPYAIHRAIDGSDQFAYRVNHHV